METDYKWIEWMGCRWLVWSDNIATMRCCRESDGKERCEAVFVPFNF